MSEQVKAFDYSMYAAQSREDIERVAKQIQERIQTGQVFLDTNPGLEHQKYLFLTALNTNTTPGSQFPHMKIRAFVDHPESEESKAYLNALRKEDQKKFPIFNVPVGQWTLVPCALPDGVNPSTTEGRNVLYRLMYDIVLNHMKEFVAGCDNFLQRADRVSRMGLEGEEEYAQFKYLSEGYLKDKKEMPLATDALAARQTRKFVTRNRNNQTYLHIDESKYEQQEIALISVIFPSDYSKHQCAAIKFHAAVPTHDCELAHRIIGGIRDFEPHLDVIPVPMYRWIRMPFDAEDQALDIQHSNPLMNKMYHERATGEQIAKQMRHELSRNQYEEKDFYSTYHPEYEKSKRQQT